MATTQMHDTETMIRLFMEIDTSDDETVTRDELVAFYRKNNIPNEKIDSWMQKFDANKDGRITLIEFCRGLGIRIDEMRTERKELLEQRAGNAPAVSGDILVVASTMPVHRQHDMTEKFKEIAQKHNMNESEMRDVAYEFKNFLDATYGAVWQCVVLTGSYWMHFSHEPFQSIQFKYNRYICLAWRTPQS